MNSIKEFVAVAGTVLLVVLIGFAVWRVINKPQSQLEKDPVAPSSSLEKIEPNVPRDYRGFFFNASAGHLPVYVAVHGGKNVIAVSDKSETNEIRIGATIGGFFGMGEKFKEMVVIDGGVMESLYEKYPEIKEGKDIEVNLKDISGDTNLIDISLDVSQKMHEAGLKPDGSGKVRSTIFNELRYEFWGDNSNIPRSGDTIYVRLFGTKDKEIRRYKLDSFTYRIRAAYYKDYPEYSLLSLEFISASRSTDKDRVTSKGEKVISSVSDLAVEIDGFYLDGFEDRNFTHRTEALPNVFNQINAIDESRLDDFNSKHYIFLTLGSFAGDKNWPSLDPSNYRSWLKNEWMLNNLSWRENRSITAKSESDFCTSKDRATFIGLDYDNKSDFKLIQRSFIENLFNGCSMSDGDFIYNNN